MLTNIEDVRRTLIRLLQNRQRSVKRSKVAPINWKPDSVRDPRLERLPDNTFTRDTCWEFILEKLEEGHEIEEIELRKPPGSKGYVMKINMGTKETQLYVKLQIGINGVMGRSFHYSGGRGKAKA